MLDTQEPIRFDAPAVLRKWPSLNGERISKSLGAHPYLVVDGTRWTIASGSSWPSPRTAATCTRSTRSLKVRW